LTEGVVYHVYGRGWLEVEGVVVVVVVVVRDKGCEVEVLVYVEYGDWVEKWVG
jgi:hypothetical protein